MVTTLSVREVNNLRYLLWKAYVGVNQKYYRIMQEPLYSYDEEKREAKKEEKRKCISDSRMYLHRYHYWDNLIGHMHTTTPPYLTDFGIVDVDMDEVQQILTLLDRMIFESNDPGDIVDFNDAYQYWKSVSKRS